MPDQCNDCPLEPRVAALEKMNERHTTTHGEMFKRLNALEKENAVQEAPYKAIMDKLDSMDKKHDALNARLEAIEKCSAAQARTLDELNERGKSNKARLDELESKSGKRWEGLVDKAIWAVCAAVIAFLLGRLGL